MAKISKWLAGFAWAFLLVAQASEASASEAQIDDPAYLKPARLVEIEKGRRLNIYCIGSGSPTVILEAGHGDGLTTWAKVQRDISRRTRVCSYDRAGFGFSDAPREPGTIQQAADDLHKLLAKAGIAPPYVMVGHSMGGMIVRLYAAQHQKEVAGLVLVDPTNEHQAEGYNRVDQRPYDVWDRANKQSFAVSEKCVAAAKSGSLTKGSTLYDDCAAADDPEFSDRINRVLIAQSVTYGAQRASAWEQESTFYKSADQLAANAGNYGSKPVIVLTRGPDPVRKGQTQAQADAEYRMLSELHEGVAARSTRGTVRSIEGTGHYIQMDAPRAVIDAIFEVIDDLSR